MKRITSSAALFIVLAASVVGGTAAPAPAHAPYQSCSGDAECNFYRYHWISDQSVAWRFTVGFPAGTWRARALNAVAAWNGLGQPMQWHQVSPDLTNFIYDDCGITWYQENALHYGALDGPGNKVAVTAPCLQVAPAGSAFAYELRSVNVQVDSSENWYTSYQTPGAVQVDLWSVLTHEWGHMSGSIAGTDGDGIGHFNEADNTICGGKSSGTRQTMCPVTLWGDTQQRDLQGPPYYHDTHTFNAAY